MERWINEKDYQIIKDSLSHDIYHTTTTPEFFYTPGTFTKVYEDESGPVLYLRAAKSLRLDIQFVNNNDYERNRNILSKDFLPFIKQCEAAGFKEVCFNTTSPLLKRFCMQKLGFKLVEGDELRYIIN